MRQLFPARCLPGVAAVRMTIAVMCFALLLPGCRSQTTPTDQLETSITVQLNWYPEVEHGGVYQALVDGLYEAAELNVDIRPGGSATPVAPELLRGRCQFAIANADDVVLYRAQGADIVAVLAAAQDHPRCLLVREDSGVKEFSDLAGMTLQRQPGRAFLEFLRKEGYLEGVREVPYFNSIAAMVNDPKVAIQAYSNAEPLLAEQQGLKVRTLMLSEIGWNPYSSVLITTGDLLRESPQLVESFVSATKQGWLHYLEHPEQGNAAILAANTHGMTPETLAFGAEQFRELAIPDGSSDSFGSMTLERWTMLVEQMESLQLIEPGQVKPEDCFRNDSPVRELTVK